MHRRVNVHCEAINQSTADHIGLLPDIEDNHAGGRDVEVENGGDHLHSSFY